MQQGIFHTGRMHGVQHSQFPLWDFFECNVLVDVNVRSHRAGTLNSLCGISLNATGVGGALPEPGYEVSVSQFPLWDFFECNFSLVREGQVLLIVTLNSLCGISLNATKVNG